MTDTGCLENLYIYKKLNIKDKLSLPDQGSHILYSSNAKKICELISPKKLLGGFIHKTDTTIFFNYADNMYNSALSIKLPHIGDALNNIICKIKINSDKRIQIEKIFDYIELEIGGMSIDKIYGSCIEALLKIYELSYTEHNNQIILPIPFGITSGNNIIVDGIILFHNCRLKIKFGSEYTIVDNLIEITTSHYVPIDEI